MQNDNIGVTFVNALIGRGSLNGVINISFGVFRFDPVQTGIAENGEPVITIDNTLSVAARLRMDITCARQLYESLGALLESIDKAQTKLPIPAIESGVSAGKPN